MTNIQAIRLEEDIFPKTFSNFIEKDFGVLFFNEHNKSSYDSNHAVIYKSKINDLDSVLDFITNFYTKMNINPNIYQAIEDEGYFKEKEAIFKKHGYFVWIEGPNNFMVLTNENVIKSNNLLQIKLITQWDERIATDICIPSDESHEIEIIKNIANKASYRVFVGYEKNKAVAIIYFHISDENLCCRFDYILVSKQYRNKGYARELLSYVTDYCRKNALTNCFQWPAHETSERICHEAGFRHLFSAEAGRASHTSKVIMTEKEKMLSGDFYNPRDKELLEDYKSCRKSLDYFNENRFDNQLEVLRDLLGKVEEGVWIEKPFFCDYGKNISIGKDTFINFNCTFLDCNRITIGKNGLIGPGTHIYAVTHPVEPTERINPNNTEGIASYNTFTKPVFIGDNVWIGGNCSILAGVSIGDNCVIGAGSVVTKDIPKNSLAAGNPCKVIRQLEEK